MIPLKCVSKQNIKKTKKKYKDILFLKNIDNHLIIVAVILNFMEMLLKLIQIKVFKPKYDALENFDILSKVILVKYFDKIIERTTKFHFEQKILFLITRVFFATRHNNKRIIITILIDLKHHVKFEKRIKKSYK